MEMVYLTPPSPHYYVKHLKNTNNTGIGIQVKLLPAIQAKSHKGGP